MWQHASGWEGRPHCYPGRPLPREDDEAGAWHRPLSLLELGLSCHISILPMAPDGFRDGRGRMSTLPPVAFDDRSFKNHRPFDRRKPHGPAPQVLTHARCRSTTAPGGASGRRKMRTSSLSQANGRTGRRNGTSSQQDGVPIFGVSRFTGGALRCSWLRGWPWDFQDFSLL